VRLPGSSSTPRPRLRSAHRRRVPCSPLPLRTRRCGPRATRTGAPGHQHHVGERELSASVGPTLPTGGVHCRPAGAGGGSASRRHRGSPTCTSSRPDHARPPPRRRRGWGRPLLLALRAWTTPPLTLATHSGAGTLPRAPVQQAADHPPPLSSRALRARSLPAARPSPVRDTCAQHVVGRQSRHRGLRACAAHLLCARVRGRTSGGLAARSGSGRSRPAPERSGVPLQTRGGPATTRRPGRTSGH